MTSRADILDAAALLISGDRASSYGDPVAMHARIGRVWGALLDRDDIPAATVLLMLAALKMARLARDTTHTDSWVDLCGYGALGAEVGIDGPR